MKNITKKQMITLIVLVVVLILVIAVQYFYRPLIEKKKTLNDKVSSMSLVYADMKMLAAVYSIDNISYEEAKAELHKKRSELREVMSNSAQDKLLTDMLVAHHLSIESSQIEKLEKEKVRVECAVDKENEDSVEGYSSISMYPRGGRVVSDEGDYVSLEYDTGECSREIYYNISGKYSDIIGFLRHIHSLKGMEISRFYFNSGDIDALIAADEAENSGEQENESTASGDSGSAEGDNEKSLPTIGNIKKTDSIIDNSIYKAGVGIRVHMYDRSFDLVSAQN
ncbi:hypothetical protein [Ruminococcus sp. HUN007]|uniref:hypothetical protein n=1 Tax=Ruminococcus sp. HUN007 TaxID=1514668 RepID=UPI0005D27C7C|nr:hypothetical protein [Ruminococcus sp. HUN007]